MREDLERLPSRSPRLPLPKRRPNAALHMLDTTAPAPADLSVPDPTRTPLYDALIALYGFDPLA